MKGPKRLTKKIHASRSAAADLGHGLACGYARGSGTGLAVAGPGSLPGPQRGSDAAATRGGSGGTSSQVCGRADAGPAAVAGSGPGQGVTVSGCAGQAAWSSSVMATATVTVTPSGVPA